MRHMVPTGVSPAGDVLTPDHRYCRGHFTNVLRMLIASSSDTRGERRISENEAGSPGAPLAARSLAERSVGVERLRSQRRFRE